MHDDLVTTLQTMRDRLAAQQRDTIACVAGTMRLLARGRDLLKQGRDLVEWFNRAEQLRLAGAPPSPILPPHQTGRI